MVNLEKGKDSGEEENDDDNEVEEEQSQLRRSTRVSTKHVYLDNYILLEEPECERLLMIINDEPWDFNEEFEILG